MNDTAPPRLRALVVAPAVAAAAYGELLEQSGHEVVAVTNLELAATVGRAAPWDILLVDIDSWGQGGLDFVAASCRPRAANAIEPIRIVVATNDSIRMAALDCGADAFLCGSDVTAALREILQQIAQLPSRLGVAGAAPTSPRRSPGKRSAR